MKICILTSGHTALDDRIFYKEAMSLAKVCTDITIVCPDNSISSLYSGVKFKPIVRRANWWNRFKNLKELYQKAIEARADIYICHELDSLIIGVLVKTKIRCKLIYDSHEFSPASFAEHFPKVFSQIVCRLLVWLEAKLIVYVDNILTVNEVLRGYFLMLNRFKRVDVLYNAPNLEIFKDFEVKKDSHEILLCHEGNLPFNRGLKQLIETFVKLRNRDKRIKLMILGDLYGEEKRWLENFAQENRLFECLIITGWQNYEKVGKYLSRADIGLIFMHSLKNNMLAGPPNKLFNYMRYALPVVAPYFPEIGRIIMEEDCGLLFPVDNYEEAYKKIMYLCENRNEAYRLGENGKKAVLQKYNWNKMEEKLLRVYNGLELKGF